MQAAYYPARLARHTDQRAKIHSLGYSFRETTRASRGRRLVRQELNGCLPDLRSDVVVFRGHETWLAVRHECLLNANRSKLVVRFQTHYAAPERGLEDVTDPAPKIAFAYLADQPRPYERSQHA